MNTKQLIPSVNFHLWEPCNMQCKFCFAGFKDVKASVLPKGHLPKKEALEVINQLAGYGFQKITFVGGEPTLCPWLHDLVAYAKALGMTTMIVTNGTMLNQEFLVNYQNILDWIGVSIDSLDKNTNKAMGRSMANGKTFNGKQYAELCENIKAHGYGLKINTVVTKYNFTEHFEDFILHVKPHRWKVMQVLPIKGQYDTHFEELSITAKEFMLFKLMHYAIEQAIFENNDNMTNSYVMVDPAGRFFSNKDGYHRYSKPILQNSIHDEYISMGYDSNEFLNRGGKYNWKCKGVKSTFETFRDTITDKQINFKN